MLFVIKNRHSGPASPEEIKRVLVYLTNQSAHPRVYVERRISSAFNCTRNAKEAKMQQVKPLRHHLGKVIEALRVLENIQRGPAGSALYRLLGLPLEAIKENREVAEHTARLFDRPHEKTGGQTNFGRRTAISQAYGLLDNFGDPPTRTRGGEWQTLAEILYDEPCVDLFVDIRKSPLGRGSRPGAHSGNK
jgi:hypothetical protein